ncbi:MAG: hypothetical protein NT077_02970, partial [Candidatus Taylorbacteria bacterium]|nr:hypothetical protein [Candidatus Taylorbacteria bacterium]
HTVTSQKSFFTRNFYLHAADSTDACVSLDECGITVEVYWNQVSVPYSVVMTSEITSTLR